MDQDAEEHKWLRPTGLRRHACRGGLRADDWEGVEEIAKGALKWLRGLSAVYERRSERRIFAVGHGDGLD